MEKKKKKKIRKSKTHEGNGDHKSVNIQNWVVYNATRTSYRSYSLSDQ